MSRLVVLVENTASGRGILAEHGLSFWIERGARRVLFDAGQGYALRHNAQQLGIPLETADALVLSHGHYDHTGGLGEVLDEIPAARIFCHPFALSSRYVRSADGSVREIGMPRGVAEKIRVLENTVWTQAPTEIFPGLSVTGPIPRANGFEDSGGAFYQDEACRRPDAFPDDQALFLEAKQGTWVLLGCAHAGVINTLNYVRELTGNRPLCGVIGGMHLVSADQERLGRTVEELCRMGVRCLMPAHCTGFHAMARLWQEFPEEYIPCPAGAAVDLDAL